MTDQILRSIAAQHGTPTYVYDLDVVTSRLERVRRAFSGFDVHYAVKANALGALLVHLRELGTGAEALTVGELERALRAGFEPQRVILGGPGHTPSLVQQALTSGVRLVSLDSLSAWALWRDTGGPETRFLIRLNPAFDPHTHQHLATAAADSKFGVPPAQALELATTIQARGQLAGFHVHAGSMLADPAVAELVVAALEPLYRRFSDLELVDFGGGFAVPDVDLEAFAEPLRAFTARHRLRALIEPGRFLVAEAGVLLTTVLHEKYGGPRDHLIADAGMADLIRPALYDAEHPLRVVAAGPLSVAAGSRSEAGRLSDTDDGLGRPLDVDGPLCENADRLARDSELGRQPAGTLLAVEAAGAYGYAMASNYVSSLRPAQVVVRDGRARLASRREVPADLWRLEEI